MFLGEWFADYHEFHISGNTSDDGRQICVWDEINGRYLLTREQASEVYRQAAGIMTCCYNVSSFEHITQWHHAAGDFIVRPEQKNLDLKLITVRRYAPLFRNTDDSASGPGNAEQILQALLIFLLKLSIQMRLDRIDGVGEIVWLDDYVVSSTVKGVFDGLSQKPAVPELPGTVDTCFKYFLSACSEEDLMDLSESILQTIPSATSDYPVIKQNLANHVRLLTESIRQI
jgi:hypothetical protein